MTKHASPIIRSGGPARSQPSLVRSSNPPAGQLRGQPVLIDRYTRDTVLPDSLVNSRTIVYTPYVNITARRLDLELDLHTGTMCLPLRADVGTDPADPEPRRLTFESRRHGCAHVPKQADPKR